MTTTCSSPCTDRELTATELDGVAGGNAALIGFFAGYLATKLLDDAAPAFKIVDQIRAMIPK